MTPAPTGELLALLDAYQPGRLAPMLRAERDLARARLAASASDGDQAAAARLAAAISSLRELSTPYHLAHGLLDHADYLTRLGDTDAAASAPSKPAPSQASCAAAAPGPGRRPDARRTPGIGT